MQAQHHFEFDVQLVERLAERKQFENCGSSTRLASRRTGHRRSAYVDQDRCHGDAGEDSMRSLISCFCFLMVLCNQNFAKSHSSPKGNTILMTSSLSSTITTHIMNLSSFSRRCMRISQTLSFMVKNYTLPIRVPLFKLKPYMDGFSLGLSPTHLSDSQSIGDIFFFKMMP